MPVFSIIAEAARKRLRSKNLPPEYSKRLEFEISEIYSQGCERIWQNYIAEKRKFDKNPYNLLLPWLLNCLTGPANVDPIATRTEPLVLTSRFSDVKRIVEQCGKLPSDLRLDDDKPDIDIDCLPEARDKIKDYAALRYGKNNVASVGTWQSYLLKHAIGDAYIALGLDKDDGGNQRGPSARGTDKNAAIQLTKDLPDDVNEMREGGYGVCKGRVKEGDVEKECGCKHNQLKCPECGSEDTETPTIAKILAENPAIGKFIETHPRHQEVIDIAVKLVGKIRNAGKHAGGIVIADRDLFGNVPMALDKSAGQWVTVWTEGRSTQLSKFGYLKWDWLGLKNLAYIKRCCQMIEENHGISFGERLEGWDETDPNAGIAGYYWENGKKVMISLNDPKALDLANRSLTDAIFQFDTDLAKRTLSFGVRSFNDLLIFNAMGHPGPLADVPEYVERRDNPENNWKQGEHSEIIKILNDTCGVIVFQEQLAAVWQRVAGFTGPEAQEARKAVAKKWRDKLKPVRQKWIDGASKEIGESKAIEWWDTMERFGRYAFNRSHAVAYCLWAYRCLWLKAYYPEEWWASVMGLCDQKALERYMGAARTEGVLFGEIALGRMTKEPIANSGRNAVDGYKQVALGLTSLKNVGDSIADVFVDTEGNKTYTDIDDFIAKKGKSKTLLERLIKLGVFVNLHPNIKATWRWYLHEYCTGDLPEIEAGNCEAFDDLDSQAAQEIKRVKSQIKSKSPNQTRFKFPIKIIKESHRRQLLANDGWTAESIVAERDRQIAEYKRLYPKRKVLPKKLLNWVPNPNDTRERVMALYTNDYDLRQVLQFEKEFLGYYWHSPCDLYHCSGAHTVEHAKVNECLEGVIIDVFYGVTKLKSTMLKLKISDGKRECLVIVWEQDLKHQPKKLLAKDVGVKLHVDYDPDRNSFTLQRGTLIEQLWSKKAWMELQATAE